MYVWGGANSATAFMFSLLAKCPTWIHDGLNSWSHCRRIHIYSAWVSGYALRHIHTQHTSIQNARPWVWRRQSCHPSRLNNMLGSVHLGNSTLTSGRLWGHCTTQRAFIHTQQILGSHHEDSILLWCFIHGDLSKAFFQVQTRKISSTH